MLTLLWNLLNGRVWMAGLIGMAAQIGLGYANGQNLAGIGEQIAAWGLGGQLASGGLVAALTGLAYAVTAPGGAGAVGASGGGAVAGGLSGVLGLGVSQALGLSPVEAGAEPILNFSQIGAYLQSLVASGGPAVSLWDLSSETDLGATFAATAAGGGLGAGLARRVVGG